MEYLKNENLVVKQKEVEETIITLTAQSEHLIDLEPTPKPDIDLAYAFDITKKLVEVYTHESGGSVYAGFRREGTTMRSDLVLGVKFPDGRCSEAIVVDQELIFDVTYQSVVTDTNTKDGVKNSKCLNVLRRYCTPEMKIDYVQIYCTLRKNFDQLPVIEFCACTPLPEVYKKILEYVKSKQDGTNIYSTCEDYPLTKEELNSIAEQEGYSAEELIRQMALSEILLTDGGKQRRFQKSMPPKPGEKPVRYYVFKNEKTLQQEAATTGIPLSIKPEAVPKSSYKGKAYLKW